MSSYVGRVSVDSEFGLNGRKRKVSSLSEVCEDEARKRKLQTAFKGLNRLTY